MKKIKNLVIFNLDDSLGKGNEVIDAGMGELLNKLLQLTKVAIISAGDWAHFEKKLLPGLPQKQYLKNLINLPCNGVQYFQYRSGWKEAHPEDLTIPEKDKMKDDLLKILSKFNEEAGSVTGKQFEFKGNEIIFSALGQKATEEAKQNFDPTRSKREEMKIALDEALFKYAVRIEGPDLIVISKAGIDKTHGIYKLHQMLEVKMHHMLYIGTALFKGGDDYAAVITGIECIQVNNQEETKKVIETVVACLNMQHKRGS
jgi:hydroxymethylpyrimidine pyrophosphatase-like HAD family hydrolase